MLNTTTVVVQYTHQKEQIYIYSDTNSGIVLMETSMSDKAIIWIMLKNIVLVVATCLSVYYISGWMIFMMLAYTSIEYNRKENDDA